MKCVFSSPDKESIYSVQWKWGNKTETYYMRRQDVSNMVMDILNDHPKCWTYRYALNLLSNVELPYGTDEYYDVRDRLLDLSYTNRTEVFNSLVNIGPNPTQYLHNDPTKSKIYAGILINGYWRSKNDHINNVPLNAIRRKMIQDVLSNPIDAMQHNSYVYGALMDYSTTK